MLPSLFPPTGLTEANEGLQLSSVAFLPTNSETWEQVEKFRFKQVNKGVQRLFSTPARFFQARVLVFPGNSPLWVLMFSSHEEEIHLLVDHVLDVAAPQV